MTQIHVMVNGYQITACTCASWLSIIDRVPPVCCISSSFRCIQCSQAPKYAYASFSQQMHNNQVCKSTTITLKTAVLKLFWTSRNKRKYQKRLLSSLAPADGHDFRPSHTDVVLQMNCWWSYTHNRCRILRKCLGNSLSSKHVGTTRQTNYDFTSYAYNNCNT